MSISGQFDKLRDPRVIKKAEQFAGYTIPAVMVNSAKVDNKTAAVLESDFQSTGALLLNNLTAKLAQALFPAGRPFHRIQVDAKIKELALQNGVQEAQLANACAEIERQSTEHLFRNASLGQLHRILRYTIATGNCLVFRDANKQKFVVWNLHNYVVRRNTYGELQQVILKQRLRPSDLPTEQVEQYLAGGRSLAAEREVNYFIEINYGARVSIQAHINETPVGTPADYPLHLCPYVVVTWNLANGEHYGRGYVEDYTGDFAKLSLLSEQLTLYAVESLQMLNIVDESTGGGSVDDYENAETGDFVPGKANGITAYERGDYQKMQALTNEIAKIEQRLSQAFMYGGNQRDAERVTAEEIRMLAAEAETLLGGAYSILAENLQTPLAYLCMYEVAIREDTEDLLYEILRDYYRPEIVTGIPALTQTTETQNLMRAVAELSQIIPVLGQLSPRFDTEKVIEMYMRANSVDLEAISKPPEQIAREAKEQANLQMQMAEAGMQPNQPQGTV